jgi:NADH:ubiquinone oxidoreductase subunit F (NADH-binding)
VLDGAAVAAAAVGADVIHVCIDCGNVGALESIDRAVEERRRAEPDRVEVMVHRTPSRYVTGEETALVHWLNGGDAKPTSTPPRPFERGVAGRPTLVDNVETLAHLAQIAHWGPDWFRSVGTSAEPGTALVTVTGAVDHAAVHEVALGSRLGDLLDRAGRTAGTGPVLIGGYFGTWHAPAELDDVELSDHGLRARGGGLGCGAVTVLPRQSCGVVEAARVLRWMAGESAGQCGMCVHGLAAIAQTFSAVARGAGRPDDIARLHRWAAQIEGRGACRMPDGAIRFLRSTLRMFGDDLARHAAGFPCEASFRPPTLPAPDRTAGFR